MFSANIYLTVLPDSDGDGMPDSWELDNGLNPNDPADAALDGDGDGHCNAMEYQAGTEPAEKNSCLKVNRFAVSGEARIEFLAASNTTYTVLYAQSLTPIVATNIVPNVSTNITTNIVWRRLADVVASRESRTVVVTDPHGADGRYYELVTPARVGGD